jgi:peptide-methionine (R)-S-oxide reductase
MPAKIEKTEAQWKALLAEKKAEPLAYHVTRKEGTERAFTGKYEGHKGDGTYLCICCGKPLFDSRPRKTDRRGWACAPRCTAPTAARIWAMCFPTGPSPQACVTA